MKPGLTFYTNMPTPYQLDFFESLSDYFDLSVIYFTSREKDRQWELQPFNGRYNVSILRNNWIARLIQKKITSFHFSSQIIKIAWSDLNRNIIVNGTYWSANVILALVCGKLRKKNVYYFGEPLFSSNNSALFYIKKILMWPVRYCTKGILGIGVNAIESYKRHGYTRPIYDVPYNINMEAFNRRSLDDDKLSILSKKYKKNEEVVILTSGALIFRKGIDTVIKAFRKIEDQNTILLVMGDGQEKEKLLQLTEGDSRIFFIGFCEKAEMPYYYRLADIFVFASRYDGWGLVINEAIAADLAIISSTAVGAAISIIKHQSNGWLCEPDNIEDFARAMEHLITDKVLRNKFVENNQINKKRLSSDYNAKIVYDICGAN